MSMSDNHYIKYDSTWTAVNCPRCQNKEAVGHGWLFKEPPPAVPPDMRISVAEVFLHTSGEECFVLRGGNSTKPI